MEVIPGASPLTETAYSPLDVFHGTKMSKLWLESGCCMPLRLCALLPRAKVYGWGLSRMCSVIFRNPEGVLRNITSCIYVKDPW